MRLAPAVRRGSVARVPTPSRARWLVAAVAALVPLAFAAFTGHAWEDYFITLQSSRHLVEGQGLVYHPGERVHTFTSPLGVLLPAACTALAGPDREEAALWLFRLINAAVLAAAAGLLWRRAESLGLGAVGRVVLFGLLFLEAKLVDFSINGMETALLVGLALWLWSELEAPAGPRPGRVALAVGGLLWTRPDAFLLGGALLAARVLVRGGPLAPDRGSEGAPGAVPAGGGPGHARPPAPWAVLIRGGLLGGLLYLPWFAWAWWYYGSPVPHTVLAKSAYTPPVDLANLILLPWQTLLGRSMLVDLFLPAYWNFGGWPAFLPVVAHALTGLAAFAWLAPGLAVPARRASLALFLGMFYLCSILLFPWYVPPWTALAAIVLAWLADGLHRAAGELGWRHLALIVRTGAIAVVALQLAVLGGVAWQMRVAQQFVETGGRRALGEWLRANAAPGDTVFLEPLGYIGYFSRLKTYDFPGLSSPEVVAAVRGGARRYADVIARLRPVWVVLRPSEAARGEFAETGVLRDYALVRIWDARPQLDRIGLLPGRAWVEGEACFLLFRRQAGAAPPP